MAYEAWTVEWDMPILVYDPFTRDTSPGWGTTRTGQTWGHDGPSSQQYVAGGVGVHAVAATGTGYRSRLTSESYRDVRQLYAVMVPVSPTGAFIRTESSVRYVDASNHYMARLNIQTDNTVDLVLVRKLAGVDTTLDTRTAAATHIPGRPIFVYFEAIGDALQARIWRDGTPEPLGWQVAAADSTFAAGGVAVVTFVQPGNTNTLPLPVEYDDFQVVTTERWVDVTSYVDTARGGAESGGSPFTISGGDTPEASADTGGVGLPLLNADQRFTPGNTVSPYYPNIAPGSRIRVRETILDQRFERFTGYVQYPEITAWTESNQDSPRDQMIVIPAVDRAAWIAQGRKFVSTLAEHIIYHGGPSLIGYWPLNEPEGPDVNPRVGEPWTLTTTKKRRAGFIATTSTAQPSITFGSPGIPPADDITSVSFTPTTITDPVTDYLYSFPLEGKRPSAFTLRSGQVLTVVCWTRPDQLLAGAGVFAIAEVNRIEPLTTNYVSIWVDSSGRLTGGGNSLDWSGFVTGPPAPADHSMPVAIRVGFDPAVLELWVRGEVYTGTLTVTSATSAVFDTALIADRYPGAVNHVQVYLGDATDWTHDEFLAQREMGLYGLERQSTGQRIGTILQYAGVDPNELGRIDGGASLMQVARLAGRDPMDLIAEAVETEQGEFYMAGDNRPVFADRVRLYNV